MMDPASSSDDDSSASTNTGENRKNQRRPLHDNDSSSDEGDDTHNDSGDDSAGHHGAPDISNFDDLPTDDSEEDDASSDDASDSDEENENEVQSDGDRSSDSEGINNEDLPLSERVASRARLGRRYYTGDRDHANQKQAENSNAADDGGKRRRAERKSRALALASERLKNVRKERAGEASKKNHDSDDSSDDSSVEASSSNKVSGETKRKKSKHAPTEMSSKRRDHFARVRKPDLNSSGVGVSIGANKYKPRDPRMVSLSGHLDADAFEKRYDFLDEMQEKEIQLLKRRVNAWKTVGKKGQRERKKVGISSQGDGSLEHDQEELVRLLQERAERKKAQVTRAAKQSVKKKIKEDVASGKSGAYYPKRSELRKMEVEAKFEEIRKRGGDEAVDKAIAKRRKKNVAKSHKLMPSHMVS